MIEIQSSPTSTFGMVEWHLDSQARTGDSGVAIRVPPGKSERSCELIRFKARAIIRGEDEVMIELQSSPTSTLEMVQLHVDAQTRGFRDWSL